MAGFFRNISEWGIRSDTPLIQAHHYRLTNILLLVMFIMSVFQTVFCFASGAIEAGIMNLSAPLVFGGALWLMKLGYTVLARVLVILLSVIGGYAVVASLGPETYFQIILLFASTFSIVFFSPEEKWLLAFGLLVPLLGFVGLEMTNYEPIFGMHREHFMPGQLLKIRVASMITIWSLMFFHFVYFVRGRQRYQEQLIASAKMVALGRMAAGIAHEVNNPLLLIVYHAERMKDLAGKEGGAQEREQIQSLAGQVQTVAMRIASIVKGLQSLSRDASNDPLVQVPVHKIVNLSLDSCRARLESQSVDLRVSPIPLELAVLGREAQLCEVILNILNNAYDAVMDRAEKSIQIDVAAYGEWVEIAIADSGPGVDLKLRHRIFDPFFTTKPVGKGTGLGLSISQGIMESHGGKIYYEPKSTGARFVMHIPRAQNLSTDLALVAPASNDA